MSTRQPLIPKSQPVAELKFGGNTIKADQSGTFTIHLAHGGDWLFDLGEISRLDEILSELQNAKQGVQERVFWRTNGTKLIQVKAEAPPPLRLVYLVEGGTRQGYFQDGEILELRKNIQILTSEGAPYGRSIRLLNVIEEGRYEELVTTQQIPLNNRNSKSPLVVERELSRESLKSVQVETSLGIGFDYYVFLNLETRFGIKREEKITERVMVRMEAQPDELKIYTIIWKEVWVTGYAEFDMGNHREKVPFRLKSGLEAEIKQETLS